MILLNNIVLIVFTVLIVILVLLPPLSRVVCWVVVLIVVAVLVVVVVLLLSIAVSLILVVLAEALETIKKFGLFYKKKFLHEGLPYLLGVPELDKQKAGPPSACCLCALSPSASSGWSCGKRSSRTCRT